MMRDTARPLTALLLSAALLAAGPLPTAQAQDSAPEDPMMLFERGMLRFHQEDYQAAIDIFRMVFELDPNPFVLFNIARCYEELRDLEAAARYYQRALAIGGLPDQAKMEALTRLERLEPVLAARQRGGALAMAHTSLDLSLLSAEREAEREAQRQLAALTPPPDPIVILSPPPPPVYPRRGAMSWTGLGLAGFGLASLGTGAAFYLSLSEDLDQQRALNLEYQRRRQDALLGNSPQAPEAIRVAQENNALAEDIKAKQLTSGILLGLGSLSVAGGLFLFYLDTPLLPEDQPLAPLRWQITPSSFSLQGSF